MPKLISFAKKSLRLTARLYETDLNDKTQDCIVYLQSLHRISNVQSFSWSYISQVKAFRDRAIVSRSSSNPPNFA